jgi:hypothetical protein
MRDYPDKLICDFCKKWRHVDELKLLRRLHKTMFICLYCIEERQLGKTDVLKRTVTGEYKKRP